MSLHYAATAARGQLGAGEAQGVWERGRASDSSLAPSPLLRPSSGCRIQAILKATPR